MDVLQLRGLGEITRPVGWHRHAWPSIEAVNMIRKGRAIWVANEDAIAQATFIAELFGIAA
jgi:hypothetical protein